MHLHQEKTHQIALITEIVSHVQKHLTNTFLPCNLSLHLFQDQVCLTLLFSGFICVLLCECLHEVVSPNQAGVVILAMACFIMSLARA